MNVVEKQLAETNIRKESSEIADWLVARLAKTLDMDPQNIDMEKELQSFGISSIEAVLLVSDLEEWLAQSLDAAIIWEYPTIKDLSQHLANSG